LKHNVSLGDGAAQNIKRRCGGEIRRTRFDLKPDNHMKKDPRLTLCLGEAATYSIHARPITLFPVPLITLISEHIRLMRDGRPEYEELADYRHDYGVRGRQSPGRSRIP